MNDKLPMADFDHVTLEYVMDACAILDAMDVAAATAARHREVDP